LRQQLCRRGPPRYRLDVKSMMSRNPRATIARQVFVAALLILALVMLLASVVLVRETTRRVERQEGSRALSIARSVASLSAVRSAFSSPNPSAVIQPIAESVRVGSGADFVVVANREQVRYSHPDPKKIGEKLSTNAGPVLQGKDFVGVEQGSLGVSVRGKTPVFDGDGNVIGIVSVGLLVEGVTNRARSDVIQLLGLLTVPMLLLGGFASFVLSRRVRSLTYDLDAAGIGALLEHRESLLASVKEGVLAVDLVGNVTLVNDEARKLVGLPALAIGMNLSQSNLAADVVASLTDTIPSTDQVLVIGQSLLVFNRRPLTIRGHTKGTICTLRDRTEVNHLTTELAGTRAVTDMLRAQAHEFSNQLHTIGGLLALEEYETAKRFVTSTGKSRAEVDVAVAQGIGEPTVAALVAAKMTQAKERSIDLRLSSANNLQRTGDSESAELLTVIGTLVDNALQAVAPGGNIELEIVQSAGWVSVTVCDSGPGIHNADVQQVFEPGFTTKVGDHAGLGLALATRACAARGGTLRLLDQNPTTFQATLNLNSKLATAI
jgi:two-component system, CitB family, sensor kinase